MNRTGEKKHRERKENKKFQDAAAASYLAVSKLVCIEYIEYSMKLFFNMHASMHGMIVDSLCTPCYTPHQRTL
jgi:hypothetical protein